MSNSPLMVFKNENSSDNNSTYTLGFLGQTELVSNNQNEMEIVDIGAVQAIEIQSGDLITRIPVEPQIFEMQFKISSRAEQPLPPIIVKGAGGPAAPPNRFETILPLSGGVSIKPVIPPQDPFTREYVIQSSFEAYTACHISGRPEIPLIKGFTIACFD
jgi:hypothetical protein